MALVDFTQLEAWQKAMDLAVKIHGVTKDFPNDERYGLTSQLRRAAVSVASNIAEGFGRYTYPDKKSKYIQSRGELVEVMSSLHYGERVKYITTSVLEDLMQDCIVVQKLLNGLISSMDKLKNSITSSLSSQVLSP